MRYKSTMIWIILIIAVIALITVGCLSLQKSNNTTAIPQPSKFMPNAHNDKFIIVQGWNETEMSKIIQDFNETYKNDGYLPYKIDSQRQSDNLYKLTFSQDINPLLFTFLINYIAYPFNLDLKMHTITVCGKTTLNTEFEGVDESLSGKQAVLYIPENDQDKDVVYMQTETGVILANKFDELKWKKVNGARLSDKVKKLIDGN